MLTKYTFYEIEMMGKHRQVRLTEGIPNAKLIPITFIKSTVLLVKIDGHSLVQISSGKTMSM